MCNYAVSNSTHAGVTRHYSQPVVVVVVADVAAAHGFVVGVDAGGDCVDVTQTIGLIKVKFILNEVNYSRY